MNGNNTGASTDVNTVLITVGTGPFGKTMLRDLSRRGYSEVRVLSRDEEKQDARVQWMKPFGYHDYNNLQMSALSDSGTLAEESSMLGFPAINPRDAIERPEGLDVGCINITGLNSDTIAQSVDAVTRMFAERVAIGSPHPVPADYCVSNTSERVVSLILGTAKLSNGWDGIRMNDLT